MPLGQADIACHVIGCQLPHETRVFQNTVHDAASDICQARVQGPLHTAPYGAPGAEPLAPGRGLHSSTAQLILSRFGRTSPCPPV